MAADRLDFRRVGLDGANPTGAHRDVGVRNGIAVALAVNAASRTVTQSSRAVMIW